MSAQHVYTCGRQTGGRSGRPEKKKKERGYRVDTFGKLTVGGGRAILSSTALARRLQMDPQEPASRHEEANECSANEDILQLEIESR